MKHRHAENQLDGILGISRDVIRDARESLDKDDWCYASAKVLYTEKGVRDLLMVLGVQLPEKKPREKGGLTMAVVLDLSAQPDPEETGVRVFEVSEKTRNQHVLVCTDGHEVVRVWVRDHTNFLPGMKLCAVHRADDLWDLHGRLPRARGVW